MRAYPLPIDHQATRQIAQSARVREFEQELLRRRRDFLILRVDRADLSKNVLRGFSAFDLFLEQHPEFSERVTFIAQLMPSRTDVPQYAEYLERIEALVAVVNHRHGTPDWMPIQLKLRDDLEEAMAAYKHYDVLLVNAMFDGMNLVAKEGPIVNEREGVSILSENTGAHEELGEYALSVNPFDIQELAELDLRGADDGPARAPPPRARGSREIVTSRDPGDWIDEQLADIRAKGAVEPLRGHPLPCRRATADDPARTHIRPRAAARPAGRGGRAREDPRRRARRDRGPGRAAAPRRLGRAAARYPIERKTERRVPPAAVPRRHSRAARRARPHAADHRRHPALSDHQAQAGHARGARHAPARRRARAEPRRREPRRPTRRGEHGARAPAEPRAGPSSQRRASPQRQP